jgi:FtsZ-binding cell division protein ZapB
MVVFTVILIIQPPRNLQSSLKRPKLLGRFQWYAEGEGMRRIREKLKSEGIYTRQGKDFTKSSLARILSNEKYYGALVRGKYSTGTVLVDKHSPRLKDKSEWHIHEGKVPAIITEELFNQCQEIKASKVNVINQKGIYKATSEYAGLIVCGKCGSTYTRNSDKGRVFFNCGKKKREGIIGCDNRNVSLKDVEGVLSAIDHGVFGSMIIRNRDEAISELKSVREHLFAKIDQDTRAEVQLRQSEIDKLKERKSHLLMMLADPAFNMSLSEIKETVLHIDNQIMVIENVIAELSRDNNAIHAEVSKVDQRIHYLMRIDPEDFDWQEELDHLIVVPVDNGWEVKFKTQELIDSLTKAKS